jgi:DNA-binding transcriptional LysR family regulator
MDLYRSNLNLLIALDILLAEQSVTNAAKRLFITQAAMSNNLQQLREIFKDELLIREKNRMILTAFSKDLQPRLHRVLQDLGGLVSCGQRFKPETSKRIFKIGMSDYMMALILPKLICTIQKKAPNITINAISASQLGALEPFEKEEYELAIGKSFDSPALLRKEFLFKDNVMCVLNDDHPLAKKKKITLTDYLAYKHIAVSPMHPNMSSYIEQVLSKFDVRRDTQLTVPFVVPIFKLIEQSNQLIGTIMKCMISLYNDNHRFVVKSLPFETPEIEFHMMWHKRFDDDLGHQWLRNQILEIGKKL